MKQFKTLKWICTLCGWTWDVLSVSDGKPLKEKCLSCESYNTSMVIQVPPIKSID